MSFDNLPPDLATVRRFLRFLDAEAVENNRKFIFLWIGQEEDVRYHEQLTAEEFCRVLPGKQSLGQQPFVCVNRMKDDKRKNENVTEFRAFFLDFDEPPLHEPLAYPPHCIVQSKGGQHWYWRTRGEQAWTWRELEYALASYFGADLASIDPARVLRVPGSWHLKDPEDPFLVTLVRCDSPERIRIEGGYMPSLYPLDVEAARKAVAKKTSGTMANWKATEALPPNMRDLLNMIRTKNYPIWHKQGTSEWHTRCPIQTHSKARVCMILHEDGKINVFCQSGDACCTSDAILAEFGVGWGIRHLKNY